MKHGVFAVCLFLAMAIVKPHHADVGVSLGTIRGRVDVRLASVAREQPNVSGLGVGRERGRADRRRSIVYLETAPRGAFETSPDARAVLDQRDETFLPYVLPVQVGTVVDFPNSDDTYHNVFSLSKPRRFDLGRYAQGKTKSVRFDQPGVVRVFCEIHSHMSAFIVVFSHRFFAATDAEGRYRIDAVPPGRYRVVVWTDGEVRDGATVDIAPGATVELDFVVD